MFNYYVTYRLGVTINGTAATVTSGHVERKKERAV